MERFRQRYGIALTKKKLQEIILMLMAWEAVFAFSYLGYIELPVVSTTTLHILVIVAAMMLGAEGSVPVVCVFAATSMWVGSYSLSPLDRMFSPFVSGMPFGSVMLVAARVLFAAGAGWLFDLYFRRPHRYVYLGIGAIGAASTLLHGLCIFAALCGCFPMLRQTILENLFSYPVFRDWLSYVLAIIACCGVHWILSRKSVKNRLSQLCDCPPAMQEFGNRKRLIYSETAAVVVGILCILFLRKAIFKELYLQGIDASESLRQNISVFLLQALVALLALFGVVSILLQWIYEYYTAQQLRMEKKLMEQRMKSSVDPLTGVFSRLAYHESLEQYAPSVPADLTVFLMDINGLKRVNDALGHEAGDELICGAARCITQAVGDRGKTFRIGGDEFVVLGHMSRPQAQQILAELHRTVAAWSGRRVKELSISAGCVFASDHPEFSVERLTKEADLAMYARKQEYYRGKKPVSGRLVPGGDASK